MMIDKDGQYVCEYCVTLGEQVSRIGFFDEQSGNHVHCIEIDKLKTSMAQYQDAKEKLILMKTIADKLDDALLRLLISIDGEYFDTGTDAKRIAKSAHSEYKAHQEKGSVDDASL